MTSRPPSVPPRRRAVKALACALAGLWLAACGGGGGNSGSGDTPAPLPPLAAGESAYDDPAAYSSAGGASLAGAVEGAAVTRHTLKLAGASIAYTARAGHLIARDPASGAAEAAIFYVDYVADGATAGRPVTFFYNGGPGSASAWLHLGSFGPKRLATGVPSTTGPQPFPLVDNAETLLDGSDLVFVDAAGTGLSQAIAPYSNASFWGVDADAALFRDFIVRWLQANGRVASPLFLYGESYGGPRTAVLARRLQEAGVAVDGLVLQSPALDYNSNCGLIGSGNCGSTLPTYAAIGAWHGLARPRPADLDAYMGELRGFTADRYGPAVAALLTAGTPPPAELPPLLAGYTGLPAPQWQAQFNLQPGSFRNSLFAGMVVGRYDGRMVATNGTALAAEGDPSSTFVSAGFNAAIGSYLRDTLRYSSRSTYVMVSGAIYGWDFSHAGRELLDTVPDLAAVLAANPSVKLLALGGYHDLATPFRTTELDLARLGGDARVQLRNYPGGHWTYLDDATRVRQKADLAAFYRAVLAAAPARDERALALHSRASRPLPDRAGVVPTTPQPVVPQAAMQAPLRDPWVPPRR